MILHMYIGVSGAGKSTDHDSLTHPHYYASSDAIIEEMSDAEGITYSEGFSRFIGPATDRMMAEVQQAIDEGRDIVWDQTNLNPKSRKPKLAMFPRYYEKIAVVFKTPDHDELCRRLASRKGKFIPLNVISNQLKSFDPPRATRNEGFDQIWQIENGIVVSKEIINFELGYN